VCRREGDVSQVVRDGGTYLASEAVWLATQC
jgi:hypothetical protein